MSGLGPEHSIDIGGGVYFRWLQFSPDRDLNPHLAHLADNPRTGIIVGHVHPDGGICEGAVLFDTPENRREEGRPLWQVESLEPLTISPSILYSTEKGGCGLHGFIREGRWAGA
jgi:hypothetical protein